MSGYKHATVTISQDEYRRLHEADLKKRFREYANLNEQTANQSADLNILIQQMEDRQRQLEEALAFSNLERNASQVDTSILQDLISRNADYYQNMISTLQETNGYMQDSLQNLSDNFSQMLQRERESYHQRFYSLLSQQEAYQQTIYDKEEAARQWLNHCFAMVEFIQQQYDHERFAPGRLAKIIRNLSLSECNLRDGFSEASVQSSQLNYLDLSDLNVELEQAVIRWQTEYLKAFSALQQLVDELSSNPVVNAIGLNGEQMVDEVDLDFWTKGKHQQLLSHCQKYQQFMEQEKNRLSIEDLDRIYNQILPTVRESFGSIIYEARTKALNSQLRMNIAETALEALEIHGFRLEDSGYTNSDMRTDFKAHLVCDDGTEISIQVVPNEKVNEELTNELVVTTTHPFLKTEHEARLRWDELNQTLNQFNLRVSQPIVLDEPGSPGSIDAGNTQSLENRMTRLER